LIAATIGLIPFALVVTTILGPAIWRGDINPLIQVILVGSAVYAFLWWRFYRQILNTPGDKLAAQTPSGLRISALTIIALMSALVAVVTVLSVIRDLRR
jgi:flagellar biosynthesis protein FlhB